MMKKALSLLLALVMCLSLCACGGNDTSKAPAETTTTAAETTTTTTAAAKAERPSAQEVANKIKYAFKDPESVYLSNGYIAPVKHDGVESDTEFYIIATVHAKNGFGGYADPEAYLMHWKNGYCNIEGKYISNDFPQKKFTELGCGACYPLK